MRADRPLSLLLHLRAVSGGRPTGTGQAGRRARAGAAEAPGLAARGGAGPYEGDFGLAGFWARWTAEFEASLGQLPVTVQLIDAALAVLPEILGDTTAATRPDPERGRHGLVPHFDSPLAARRRLLGFGPDAGVLERADIRRQSADAARRAAARYGPLP
ncbi:WYL domain-containing protein [Streptomyces carpinensis]|uniref:WYL domain-containing protein n=1 Tax=Streptomyces carpinensis TaxID=66369 RepID=UPI000A37DEC4|nr:WYL domain-containing protein [Streptomyces carpinensis]